MPATLHLTGITVPGVTLGHSHANSEPCCATCRSVARRGAWSMHLPAWCCQCSPIMATARPVYGGISPPHETHATVLSRWLPQILALLCDALWHGLPP